MGTILFGVLTGIWLRRPKSLSTKAAGLLGASISGLVLGNVWNVWFPINKKLWTSSYVLFAAGCTLLLLALCFYAVEIKKWTRGWTFPWLVFGSNAITAYVFSELLAAALSYHHVCMTAAGSPTCSSTSTSTGSFPSSILHSDR